MTAHLPPSSAAGPTLAALRHAVLSGETTSVGLVQQCLSRIAELDTGPGRLGAVLALNPDAETAAAAADAAARAGGDLGSLHGIPILVKDVFETQGIETTFGCRAFSGYVPARDAEAVRRLRAAGAVVVGKTSTPDLAMSWLSHSSLGVSAVNIRSRLHEAGGSSSGSAVAVAAGLVPAALGSDTGGSVRVPASFNGVVGVRPTTGLVPTRGMSALVAAQDTPGPIAACVDDAATLLGVIAGRSWAERDRPVRELRFGMLVRPDLAAGWPGAEEVAGCVDAATDLLRAAGGHLENVEVRGLGSLMRDSALYLVAARDDLDRFLLSRPKLGVHSFVELYETGVFPETLDLARLLVTRSQPDPALLAERLRNRQRLRGALVQAMGERRLDALVYPTVQVPPPRRDRGLPSLLLPVNTLIASQADLPAVTLPAGTTTEGLPVGLELLGRPGADGSLLRLGRVLERVFRAP